MVEIDMRVPSHGLGSASSGTAPGDQLTISKGDNPDDDLTVEVCSELDLSTAPSLRSLLDAAVQAPVRRVVVDLSAVEFMDCASLRPLRAAARTLRLQGRDLMLRDPSPPVRRLLDLTGVGNELPLDPPSTPGTPRLTQGLPGETASGADVWTADPSPPPRG